MKRHLKKYWPVYLQVGLMVGGFILGAPDSAFAGSLDAQGNKIYTKIKDIAKWAIIIKGGIEIIQNILAGDTQSAKKTFLGYIAVYGVLFALPWGMDLIEQTFGQG